jgi:hypothetical protein
VEADLLDDGEVVATGPAGAPLVFPVTSAPHNNPGSELTVVVRDAAGQTAQTSIYQPAVVQDPGSKVWTTQEPNDGQASTAGGVALQGKNVIAAGVHWTNGDLVGTLRRYDLGGAWIGTDDGWSKKHTDWTKRPELATAVVGLTGVAVDADLNIIAVGIAFVAGEPRMYVARFHPDGTLHWEVLGEVPTEARAVGVQADGTIWVAGAVRTKRRPGAVGPGDVGLRPGQAGPRTGHLQRPRRLHAERSERGRAVAVLPGGRVVVAGTREVYVDVQTRCVLRGVALVYEGKGKRIGEWTSPGDKMFYDEILAAVATDTGVALCGYAKEDSDRSGPAAADPRALARRGAGRGEGAAPRDHARRRRVQRGRLQPRGRDDRRRERQRARPGQQPVDLRGPRRRAAAGRLHAARRPGLRRRPRARAGVRLHVRVGRVRGGRRRPKWIAGLRRG